MNGNNSHHSEDEEFVNVQGENIEGMDVIADLDGDAGEYIHHTVLQWKRPLACDAPNDQPCTFCPFEPQAP